MAFKVVNLFGLPSLSTEEAEALVAEAGGQFVSAFCQSEDEIVSAAAGADAVVGVFTDGIQTISGKMMDQLPDLKHISVMGIGFEGVDLPAATERGICVSNSPDYGLEEMADHTLLFVLALAKKLLPTIDAVRAGKWDAPGQHTVRAEVLPPLFRLSAQTLGIIGFGNIPRAVIPRARVFGLKLLAHSAHVPADVIRGFEVEPVDLDTLLRESDFVSLHSALTEDNRNMIGLKELRKMKPTAFLINTARGGLVDEQDLCTALTEGIIAGAAIDVMDPEPPDPDNPLLRAPNLIITPHTGQMSQQSQAAINRMPYEEIVRVVQGGWPRDTAFRNPEVQKRFATRWRDTSVRDS
jgi:D-3-phosphoglycerate dehydrogenase